MIVSVKWSFWKAPWHSSLGLFPIWETAETSGTVSLINWCGYGNMMLLHKFSTIRGKSPAAASLCVKKMLFPVNLQLQQLLYYNLSPGELFLISVTPSHCLWIWQEIHASSFSVVISAANPYIPFWLSLCLSDVSYQHNEHQHHRKASWDKDFE